jgi:hypothetical protein
MNHILIAILIVLLKKVDGNKEAPQRWVVEASVCLGRASVEGDFVLGVQWGEERSHRLESVRICSACGPHPSIDLSAYMRLGMHICGQKLDNLPHLSAPQIGRYSIVRVLLECLEKHQILHSRR